MYGGDTLTPTLGAVIALSPLPPASVPVTEAGVAAAGGSTTLSRAKVF